MAVNRYLVLHGVRKGTYGSHKTSQKYQSQEKDEREEDLNEEDLISSWVREVGKNVL
jgi:hypothetical protein